jgi:uncharacterized protein
LLWNLEIAHGVSLVREKADGRIKDSSQHSSNLEFELKFKHVPERLFTHKTRGVDKERVWSMEHFFERLRAEMRREF